MSQLRKWKWWYAGAFIAVTLVGGSACSAQSPRKGPISWWPDPASGIMWAGAESPMGVNQAQAITYCSSLNIGEVSGWRLPTIEEAETGVAIYSFRGNAGQPDSALGFKGGVWAKDGMNLWTSTPAGPGKARTYSLGNERHVLFAGDPSNIDSHFNHYVECVRTMEPELESIAKGAQVQWTVPDVKTLQAYVPLHDAMVAYEAGKFDDTIADAKAAISSKADFNEAYFGMGLAYGRLGQWDAAIESFDAAIKISNHDDRAKAGLSWAKKRKGGESPSKKNQPPVWIDEAPVRKFI